MVFDSRGKGAKGERAVAAQLEAWWRAVEPSARFVRTPGSGGWGKPEHRADLRASGDLSTTATRFPWVVEVKHREEWSLLRLVSGMPSPVWSWWRQAQVAAEEMGMEPLLVFRKNREPWRAMLSEEAWGVRRYFNVEDLVTWREEELERVDYGTVFPCFTLLDRLLEKRASAFARRP